MSKNGLFLISIGCLFILLSCMMPTPIYLIATGLVAAAAGIWLCCKGSRKDRKV